MYDVTHETRSVSIDIDGSHDGVSVQALGASALAQQPPAALHRRISITLTLHGKRRH
jgi:hypothetical protein